MNAGKQLVAGEAILSGATTIERSREELLEAQVREHSRIVFRISYAVLRRHHDAEDATQETFMCCILCTTARSSGHYHCSRYCPGR